MRKTNSMESMHPVKLLSLLEATASYTDCSPLNEVSLYFWGLCLLKPKLCAKLVTAVEFALCFSCKYWDTLASNVIFFFPSLINNSSSVFLIIRIKCWPCSIHHLFHLFVMLLFAFFHVHHKKVILGNGFINNCNHNAVTLISSEWNE